MQSGMMTEIEQLIQEIEACARDLAVAPSTIGERAGQGGRFYARLKAGKRVWPETIAAVRVRIQELRSAAIPNPQPEDPAHDNA